MGSDPLISCRRTTDLAITATASTSRHCRKPADQWTTPARLRAHSPGRAVAKREAAPLRDAQRSPCCLSPLALQWWNGGMVEWWNGGASDGSASTGSSKGRVTNTSHQYFHCGTGILRIMRPPDPVELAGNPTDRRPPCERVNVHAD